MTPEDPARDPQIDDTLREGALSRRQILTAGLAAAGAGLAPAQALAQKAEAQRATIAVAAAGSTAVEFRVHVQQTGPTGELFTAFGYLTRAAGTTDDDLFAGPTQNEGTALLTAYASGELVRRIHDGSVHSVDIEGTLTVYQRPSPGASYNDPGSFQVGTPVASFAVTLQDVLTVFAPGKGLPTLTGDLRQTSAARLSGIADGSPFGHVGARAHMLATGLGTLVDAATLNSVLEMGGHWTTV